MKKVILIGVALCMALVIAAPAMALDTKFSGYFFVKGYHNSNYGLNDNDASDSYMTMKLRVRTDFMVSDNLSLTTRFDALDNKRWGDDDLNTGRDADNIDWDRAFMTIKTDYGVFSAGRMSAQSWGTSFNDTNTEKDRLKWVGSFGDLTTIVIYQKSAEGDEGRDVSDQDADVYYFAPYYKMDNMTFGILWGYVINKTVADRDDKFLVSVPYFTGQFGPVGLQGELRHHGFGERDYDDPNIKDQDYKALAWNLEGSYSMDMFKFELGWVHVDGQGTDKDLVGYGGAIGDDWEKIWILTGSTDDNTAASLGGVGNLSDTGSAAGGPLAQHGCDLYYGGVTVMPMEGLDVGLLVAYGQADEEKDQFGNKLDDEYGWEYDLRLNYKIFDNLNYSFIAAYLDAGDFWKDKGGIDKKDFEDNFHLYHALTLTF